MLQQEKEQEYQEYIEKFASDNILASNSEIDTYPIPRMMENFEFITKVYNLLNEDKYKKVCLNFYLQANPTFDNKATQTPML